MASYKVAQDVEAEDKLLGPFSFRQFIYLVIAVMAGIVAYGLSRLFLPLFIIPVPITLFFLILALPLRKDQPMEIYLAAIVSFYLKPRKRLWKPDGIQSLVEITVPATQEVSRTKDLSESEAERRLAYLATLADTQGWSIRNATLPVEENSSMVSDIYNEARAVPDVFDDSGDIARSFEDRINKADAARRQAMLAGMQQAATVQQQQMAAQSTAPLDSSSTIPTALPATPAPTTDESAALNYNPYPSSMRQRIITPGNNSAPSSAQSPAAPQPTTEVVQAPPQVSQSAAPQQQPADTANQPSIENTPAETADTSTSDNTVSPDIINLANNSDLSIDTIAREAQRIQDKKSQKDPDEVVISLR